MKLVLTDFYHQPTQRFLASLKEASIPYQHVNVTYDGFAPSEILNPIASAIGADTLPDKAFHYNEVRVPEFYEIRNLDGIKAEILQGDVLRGYVYYAPNTNRLVREVVWLNRAGIPTIAYRYNRQGFKFADILYNFEGKSQKEIYYTAEGKKVLTYDVASRIIIAHSDNKDDNKVFPNMTAFVKEFVLKVAATANEVDNQVDEILINSMSTPFFVSSQIPEIPSTLYFQEAIGDEIPGNMQQILTGNTSTMRILFENAKVLAKTEQLAQKQNETKNVQLAYLGAIENIRRENTYRRNYLTITRSDQILYDENIAKLLLELGGTWTIAAPSEISDKLRAFADAHTNVSVLEAISPKKLPELLEKHDIYLDINQGNEWENLVQRAYLEGLLVIADKSVAKNPSYELILENEAEIATLVSRSDLSAELRVMREKKGKPASIQDYQAVFSR
jgi:accessory Sec system glycosyltransferase GtfB